MALYNAEPRVQNPTGMPDPQVPPGAGGRAGRYRSLAPRAPQGPAQQTSVAGWRPGLPVPQQAPPSGPASPTTVANWRPGMPPPNAPPAPQMPVIQPESWRPGQRPVTPPTAPPAPVQPPTTMRPVTQPPIVTTEANLPIDPGSPEFENQLRGNVYTPGADPRLTGAQTRTDAAAAAFQGGPTHSARADARAAGYRSLFGTGNVTAAGIDPRVAGGPDVDPNASNRYLDEQDAAVAGLNGPSRTELARQALRDFDQQGERDLQNRFRGVGRAAAKFGRIGMGDVNAELGSIQGDFERDRMVRENELARSVAEGDISDRFRRVGAVSGLRGQESGIESGLRGESRVEREYDTGLAERNVGRQFDERDFTTGLGERNQDRLLARQGLSLDAGSRDAASDIDLQRGQLNEAQDLESRVFGQGQDNRNEFRTERQYQQGASQQSLDNRIRERAIAEQERSNRLTRAIALMQAGGRVPDLETLVGG